MASETVPYGRVTQRKSPVAEVHILWITAGLGCDGDSVSVTAATQPSIEDVLLGAIPGLPKVHLHNPVLAYEVGGDFMKFWYDAEAGRLDPFVLVVEGSIPNEKIKKEGYWAAFGTDPHTEQRGPRTGMRRVGSVASRPVNCHGLPGGSYCWLLRALICLRAVPASGSSGASSRKRSRSEIAPSRSPFL